MVFLEKWFNQFLLKNNIYFNNQKSLKTDDFMAVKVNIVFKQKLVEPFF
jgi:hypothetical protein